MPRKNATSERLDQLEERLARIEEAVRHLSFPPGPYSSKGQLIDTREITVEPWKHLVRRPHPWRKQLYLRGRNMTARQLVGGMRANHLDEGKAAANYGVPIEGVQEALTYVEENKKLLETEAEIERLMLQREGISRGPQPVSG
jgi:hypothetical protein